MRKPAKWISVILAAVLATSSIQVPAYAGEAGSTAKESIEAAVAAEAEESTQEGSFQEEDRTREEADRAVAPEAESQHEENEQLETSEDVAEEDVPVESVDEGKSVEDADEEGSLGSDFAEPEIEESAANSAAEAGMTSEEASANPATEAETMSEEASADRTSEAPLLTDEQIRAFQEHVAVWRNDGGLFVVFDSTEDADIKCSVYSQGTDEPLLQETLTWDGEAGLYNAHFDASSMSSGPVKIVITDGANEYESAVSTGCGDIVSLTEILKDTGETAESTEEIAETTKEAETTEEASAAEEETGEMTPVSLTWNSVSDANGYLIKVTNMDGSFRIYKTVENSIDLTETRDSICEVSVAAFNYDGNRKQFGSAAVLTIDLAESQNDGGELETQDAAAEGTGEASTFNEKKTLGVLNSTTSNTCGQNLTWELDDEGTLTISGTGDMSNYQARVAPWYYDSRDLIKAVVVQEGVTSIGNYAFYGLENCTDFSLPQTLTAIGDSGFSSCRALTEIVLPAGIVVLGDNAFRGCLNLQKVVLPNENLEVGINVFSGCPDNLQLLDSNNNVVEKSTVDVIAPDRTKNYGQNNKNGISNSPKKSFFKKEDSGWIRVEYYEGAVTREQYDEEGKLLSKNSIACELPIYGGCFEGESGYYLIFGQNNMEQDDNREVIRVVSYSKDWVRKGAASVYGANTIAPFTLGTTSLTESGDMLYLRTSHTMYTTSDGENHQANMTIVIRKSDMAVVGKNDYVDNAESGYVSHSLNQIIKTDGEDIIAVDEGDAHPRGIILFRFSGKAGAEKLGNPENILLMTFAGSYGGINTGASVGGLEITDTHYVVAGGSVVQDEAAYNINAVHNIFVVATRKDNVPLSGVETYWITSYTGEERVTTPMTTMLPDGRILLMWTVDDVINYCFLHEDGSQDGAVFTGEGSLSDCQPYVKDNTVWWYATFGEEPVYYYISLSSPDQIHVKNPGHTLHLDPMGGTLDTTEIEVVHGAKYGDLPVPQNDAEYEFLGWYTGKHYGKRIYNTSTVQVRQSETLYAHWKHLWSFSEDTGTLTVLDEKAMLEHGDDLAQYKDRTRKVVIADGITQTGYGTFSGFTALESVEFPDTMKFMNDSCFSGCTGLKSITLPNSLEKIHGGVFSDCTGLTDIIIPTGVTSIGRTAFKGCTGLTSVDLPSSVTSIGSSVFEGCTGLTSVDLSSITSIGGNAFKGCSGLTSIDIPSGVTVINSSTFMDCTALTEVNIPASVTEMSYQVFENCSSLEHVTLPQNLTSMDYRIFYKCTSLTNVEIPAGVSVIPFWAFRDCDKLEHVSLPDGLKEMKDGAFSNCIALTAIEIPEHTEIIGSDVFAYCNSLSEIIIPDSVTSIGSSALSATAVTSVTLPAGLTKIESWLFAYCKKLTHISIPSSVTSIGEYAFSSCESLKDVIIPSGVTSIGPDAFSSCSALTEIAIPAGVATLEDYTFSYCSNLNSIIIPNSVTVIGNDVFRKAPVKYVYFMGTEAEWNAVTIGDDAVLSEANIICVSNPSDLQYAQIEGITDAVYTGMAIQPELVVSLVGNVLTKNIDYTVTVSNNVNVGTATVTIRGAGKYTGELNRTFAIKAASIADATVSALPDAVYTGTAITPVPVVKLGGVTLKPDQDYTVVVTDNVNVGTATVTISGIGNYTESLRRTFAISAASITDATVSGLSDATYTGSTITPELVVKIGEATLRAWWDYTFAYSDNVNVGTATVTIRGNGNYTGELVKTFAIKAASITDAIVSDIYDMTYRGTEIVPVPVVRIGRKVLEAGQDYMVAASDNVNAGTASVTISGIGNYTGVIQRTFTIKAASIAEADVSGLSDAVYTGTAVNPVPVVKLGGVTLKPDQDYTVYTTDNVNAGTAAVTIRGIGNYTGTLYRTFDISAASIADATVSGLSDAVYTGTAVKPVPIVKVGGITLVSGTDYRVSITNNVNAGTATVKIIGIGNYTGELNKTFEIEAASIEGAAVSGVTNATYTGAAIKPVPVVKVDGVTLVLGRDYELSYAHNVNAGTASVIINGIGNYTGKVETRFEVQKATQNITVSPETVTLTPGKAAALTVAENIGDVSYTSSDSEVALVTEDGKVTANKVGEAEITVSAAATDNYEGAVKTVTVNVLPAATTSFTAANLATGIKLTWKKVDGATGYYIYRGGKRVASIGKGTTLTFTDKTANRNGTKYTYKIFAKGSTGTSKLYKSVVMYRLARPTITSYKNVATRKMVLKWGKNAKTNGYQIQYSLKSNFSGVKTVTIAKYSIVTRTIGSLKKGKTYYVRLRSYKTVNKKKYYSAWSGTRKVTIKK